MHGVLCIEFIIHCTYYNMYCIQVGMILSIEELCPEWIRRRMIGEKKGTKKHAEFYFQDKLHIERSDYEKFEKACQPQSNGELFDKISNLKAVLNSLSDQQACQSQLNGELFDKISNLEAVLNSLSDQQKVVLNSLSYQKAELTKVESILTENYCNS